MILLVFHLWKEVTVWQVPTWRSQRNRKRSQNKLIFWSKILLKKFNQQMNHQTFLPAALFVFPIKTSGWLCDDGGFRWALPFRTHGDDRLRGGNDWGMRLPPTDRILGSDKVTRSIGKGSDIFPWSKKWFKSHRKSTGKGCCVAWRMCQFATCHEWQTL